MKVKNPDFNGVCFDSRYTVQEVKEQISEQRAKIGAWILATVDLKYPDVNSIKYIVRMLVELLKIKHVLEFKSYVENDTLYLDVGRNDTEYLIEDEIESWKDCILGYQEEFLIYMLSDWKNLFDEDKEQIVSTVRYKVKHLVDDMDECVEYYVIYKLAQINYKNKVEEKPLTLSDLNHETNTSESNPDNSD